MPVIENPQSLEGRRGSGYPAPFQAGYRGRITRALTGPLGLTQFGDNVTTLEPGAKSAERHWHAKEDEFVYMLEGELVLITDEGERVLTPGMAAGFPAGVANGHHLVNKSTRPATYLEIGTRSPDEVATYPDIDLSVIKTNGVAKSFYKNGTPY
ncbi:MAG: cupin domain-containing protein [Hyphomicrobiaceae bacterium]